MIDAEDLSRAIAAACRSVRWRRVLGVDEGTVRNDLKILRNNSAKSAENIRTGSAATKARRAEIAAASKFVVDDEFDEHSAAAAKSNVNVTFTDEMEACEFTRNLWGKEGAALG